MGPRLVGPAAILLALAAAVLLATPASSAQQSSTPRTRILVGFDPGVRLTAQRDALGEAGATANGRIRPLRTFVASVPTADRASALAELRRDPRVRFAEQDVAYSIDTLPNDPSFGQLWGLNNTGQPVKTSVGTPDADIDAPEAWGTTTGSSSVVVAVVDSGVDWHHPDLAANIWTNPGESCPGCATDGVDNDGNGYVDDVRGWDFVNDDNDPSDDNGHGTHVAGTIGASGSNGVGVTGVNWNVQIMPLKFIAANGEGTADDAVRAILYATRMGAVVSNNSWGGEEFSQALEDSIADADAHGSLFVAAAGNSARNTDTTPDYPSGFDVPNVLTIGATDQSDVRAWFSNYGRRSVDLAAPGTNIYSTWPGGSYRFLDGTSMAAPHATGVVALAKAAFPSASAIGLKTLLLRTVDPNSSFAGLSSTGGRLNARSAVTCGSEAQVWVESPAAGFDVDVGKPVPVTVLGAACGDPAAATVSLSGNGAQVVLTPRGDGLYTGSYTPTSAGPVSLVATATAAGGTDTQTVSGTATAAPPIVAGGPPVTVTVANPGETARLTFDGVAGERVSLLIDDVTIGTSCCSSAALTILGPDGTALVPPSGFGTRGGFVDTRTLPRSGSYRIVVDPSGASVGSVSLTLYDVPPDAEAPIVPGGDPASIEATVPGQGAVLTFDGVAGRRIALKLTDVTIGTACCSSAKVSVLKPDGTTLISPMGFGLSGGFVDTKTLPQTGSYRILVDPQSNAVGSAAVMLYDVPPDVQTDVVPGGAPASLTISVPGQNGSFRFDGVAGRRIALKLTDVTIGTACCSSAKVSVLKPDGTALVSATGFGTSGGFIDAKTLPVSGSYLIVIDPQSSAVGSAAVTLYDVPADVAANAIVGGPAVTVAMTVPGQNGRVTFTGTGGQTVTLKLTGVTIGTSCCTSAKVSVLKPDGTTLVSPAYFGLSGKTFSFSLPATGTYSVFVDPQSNGVGSVTVSIS
jgi:subtilisin family serine protease